MSPRDETPRQENQAFRLRLVFEVNKKSDSINLLKRKLGDIKAGVYLDFERPPSQKIEAEV